MFCTNAINILAGINGVEVGQLPAPSSSSTWSSCRGRGGQAAGVVGVELPGSLGSSCRGRGGRAAGVVGVQTLVLCVSHLTVHCCLPRTVEAQLVR